MPDYAFPGIDDARVATGLAGFVGTLRRVRRSATASPRSRGAAAERAPRHEPRLRPRAAPHGRRRRPREPDPSPRPAGEAPRARRDHGRRASRRRCTRGPPSSPARVALAAIAAARARRPAAVWSRVRVVLPLVRLRGRVRAVRARRRRRSRSGRCRSPRPGLATFALVTAKATIGAVSAVLLGATTSFPDILHGLERLRAPRLLILIAAFMYRYLFVIVDEARRMRAALAARGYRPRHLGQAAALGRIVTALFLRSYERGERVLPGDARARLRRGDAAPGRARLPPRRRGVPRRAGAGARPAAVSPRWRHELRGPRPRPALPLSERRRRARRRRPARHARRARRGARAQRRRQDDADAPPQRPADRRGRARGRRPPRRRGRRARAARRASGSSSRTPTTSSSCRPSREDVAFGPLNLGLAARGGPRARGRGARGRADGARRPTARRTSSRSASGGASRSRPCSRCARGCSCSTSRRRTSTRARGASCSRCSTRIDRTMLVVTHDLPFAAQLCERAVVLSGGRIVADGAVRGDPGATSGCSPRTTSSCRRASTSAGWQRRRSR